MTENEFRGAHTYRGPGACTFDGDCGAGPNAPQHVPSGMTENENEIHGYRAGRTACDLRLIGAPRGAVVTAVTDWRDVTCDACLLKPPVRLSTPTLADPLEAPMPAKPQDRYFTAGAGEAVLRRDAALARVDRYERRLKTVDVTIEHSREVMVEWAQRLGEAMALRERIQSELRAALSEVQAGVLGRDTPGRQDGSRGSSAGWTSEGATVPDPSSKPLPY